MSWYVQVTAARYLAMKSREATFWRFQRVKRSNIFSAFHLPAPGGKTIPLPFLL